MSKYYRLITAITIMVVMLVTGESLIEAATLHVDDDYATPVHSACEERTGASDDPYCTIQDTINIASGGDVVLVDDGTYVERIDFLGKAITVQSKNGRDLTTIDGSNQQGSVVSFKTGEQDDSILDGFTVTGGTGGAGGGVFFGESINPEVRNCIIIGNTADNGGGIYSSCVSPTITNCIIKDNNGGGIYGYSPFTITGCVISGNKSSTGGGLYIAYNSIVSDSIISGNESSASGGGIYIYGFSGKFINCVISGNVSNKYGGGIYGRGTINGMFINCIINGNSARLSGGGMYIDDFHRYQDCSPKIINCTFSGNRATAGGGIYSRGAFYSNKNMILLVTNSILWGNKAINGSQYNEILADNIDINYSSFNPSYIYKPWIGNNNINSDPLFVDPRPASEAPTIEGDYHLLPGSPCIEKGTSAGAPTDDIDGDSRPRGTGYDIGADEYPCIDSDGDNYYDIAGCGFPFDNCPSVSNAGQEDQDGDGVGDVCDDCLNDPNKSDPGQCGCGVIDDSDGDGYYACGADCDDTDPDIYPGATEICDNKDNDCDDSTDEDLSQATTCGVGECAGNTGIETCTAGSWDNDTCNPFAGATAEVCDGMDNDCDDETDEIFTDTDGDGFGDPCDDCPNDPEKIDPGVCGCGVIDTDFDGDGYYACGANPDCDDTDPAVYPGMSEFCNNNIDDNCDGQVDEQGCQSLTQEILALYHMNNDWNDASINENNGTRYGAGAEFNTTDPKLGSAAGEFNGLDDYVNCGSDASLDISGDLTLSFWVKPDENLGNVSAIVDMAQEGELIENYAVLNDFYFQYYSNDWQQLEIKDFYTLNQWQHVVVIYNQGTITAYKNGDLMGQISGKPAPVPDTANVLNIGRYQIGSLGYYHGLIDELAIWSRAISVDEVALLYNSGAGKEICSTLEIFYRDVDGDGYGDPNDSIQDCAPPSGYVSDNTDCDDTDDAAYPGAPEVCDGIDNDCNGSSDENFTDTDGDGFGDPCDNCPNDPNKSNPGVCGCGVTSDSDGDGYFVCGANPDCDDTDPDINPGTSEICFNSIDDNCNSQVDEQGCLPLASGLQALYHMNNDWNDATGNENNGTYVNPVEFSNISKIGSHAGSFNGGYIDTGDGVNIANSSFSIAVWAKRNSSGELDYIVAQGDRSNNSALHFGFRDSNVFTLSFYFNDLNTLDTYVDNNWHHWVGTYEVDTNERRIYRDGDLVAIDTAPTDYRGQGSLYIGRPSWSIHQHNFNGLIDELAIWNRTISVDEVASLYNSGAGRELNSCTHDVFYRDVDGDGDGDPDDSVQDCALPSGYVSDNTDCDDADKGINPGVMELCGDGIDNDCDNEIDGDECLLPGDVNGDGNVTSLDALMTFQHCLGNIELNPFQQQHADVNQDSSITPADALCIFQKYLGLPSCLDE